MEKSEEPSRPQGRLQFQNINSSTMKEISEINSFVTCSRKLQNALYRIKLFSNIFLFLGSGFKFGEEKTR